MYKNTNGSKLPTDNEFFALQMKISQKINADILAASTAKKKDTLKKGFTPTTVREKMFHVLFRGAP